MSRSKSGRNHKNFYINITNWKSEVTRYTTACEKCVLFATSLCYCPLEICKQKLPNWCTCASKGGGGTCPTVGDANATQFYM